MNLQGITGPIIAAVNPMVQGLLRVSIGYTTDGAGNRIPGYADPVSLPVQVQALGGRELQHLDGLNLAGITQGIYITGDAESAVRVLIKGGDLFILDGPLGVSQTWLVVAVLERWADWVKVAVLLQNGP